MMGSALEKSKAEGRFGSDSLLLWLWNVNSHYNLNCHWTWQLTKNVKEKGLALGHEEKERCKGKHKEQGHFYDSNWLEQFHLANSSQINRQLKSSNEEEFWLKAQALHWILELNLFLKTFFFFYWRVFVVVVYSLLCLTVCNLMDYSPPGYSVHGISQARILEWVAISFSRGSSWPRDQTHFSCIFR